jgi:hypothetical protein
MILTRAAAEQDGCRWQRRLNVIASQDPRRSW